MHTHAFVICWHGIAPDIDVELIYASIRSHFASDAGRLVQSFVNANRAHFAQLLGTMQTTAAGGGGVAIDEDDNTEDNCGGRLVLCSKRSEHADWFSGTLIHHLAYRKQVEE